MGKIAFLALLGLLGIAVLGWAIGTNGVEPDLTSHQVDRLARSIAKSEDHIGPHTLAQWMVEERKDFVVIDIRSPQDYAAGHIDGATNITVDDLLDLSTLRRLPRHKAIVLYSNATGRAGQATVVLRLAGLNAYALNGGFVYWVEHTLNPQDHGPPPSEDLDQARRLALARKLKDCDDPLPRAPMPERAEGAPKQAYTPPLEPAEEGGLGLIAPDEEDVGGGFGLIIEEGC
jgi:rhodanese-related sulfurtransferase